jgi:hypothetical protein
LVSVAAGQEIRKLPSGNFAGLCPVSNPLQSLPGRISTGSSGRRLASEQAPRMTAVLCYLTVNLGLLDRQFRVVSGPSGTQKAAIQEEFSANVR